MGKEREQRDKNLERVRGEEEEEDEEEGRLAD